VAPFKLFKIKTTCFIIFHTAIGIIDSVKKRKNIVCPKSDIFGARETLNSA
jgi:hypothetical protein